MNEPSPASLFHKGSEPGAEADSRYHVRTIECGPVARLSLVPAAWQRSASVIDENVDSAERRQGLVGHAGGGIRVTEIADDDRHLIRATKLLRHGASSLLVPTVDNNSHAFLRESPGDLDADSL